MQTTTALVTAGGTREPIDDVRLITNRSSGRFGEAIARQLVVQGAQTTLLGSKLLNERLGRDVPFATERFDSFADLEEALTEKQATPPNLLFMAAAVADFTPVPTEGKISSSEDELTITMRRNPKLIAGFREAYGIETFIVGFKLLSNVSERRLIAAAQKQLRENRLNLVVANDLAQIRDGQHPVILLTPEGGIIRLTGSKAEVAMKLVEFVLRRYRVYWHTSVCQGPWAPERESESWMNAVRLLALGQEGQLFPDTSGNVSYRGFEGYWTSPRGVQKSEIGADAFLYATRDDATREVRYFGTQKPSIDSGVHGLLYEKLPWLHGLLHFHDGLVLTDAETSFAYPCGTVEEAEEICETLALARKQDDFAIMLTNHGYLIGLGKGGLKRLDRQWQRTKGLYDEHLESIGEHPATLPRCMPVFVSAKIVGLVAFFDDRGFASLFLAPEVRGKGWGSKIVAQMRKKPWVIGAHERCEVLEYYLARDYAVVGNDGDVTLLVAGQWLLDLQEAATVCLYNPATSHVLIGKRGRDPWEGYWAFPGGRMEEWETDYFVTAVRELQEETQIESIVVVPRRILDVCISDGTRPYHVRSYICEVTEEPQPYATSELNARWIPIEDALALRPMGAGTRRILQQLKAHLAEVL